MRCLKCGLVGDGMGQATRRDLLHVRGWAGAIEQGGSCSTSPKDEAVGRDECRMSRVRGRRLPLDVLRLGMPAGHVRSRHE